MEFFSDDPLSIVQPEGMVSFFAPSDPASVENLMLEELAFITFTEQDLRKFTAREGIKRKEAWKNRNNQIYAGQGWTVARSPFGSPSAVMLLEELIAFGVKRAVFFGYCGSLQKGVDVGDVVIPMDSVREEGTSYHYLRQDEKSLPDQALQQRLFEWIKGLNIRVHTGKVWTTDAPYRETLEKVNRYRTEGILGVEMEMSAVFALGMVRHVSVGAILFVSDVLRERRWDIGFRSPAIKAARDQVAEHLLTHIEEMLP